MCKLDSETVKLTPVNLPKKTAAYPEREATVVYVNVGFLCLISLQVFKFLK